MYMYKLFNKRNSIQLKVATGYNRLKLQAIL